METNGIPAGYHQARWEKGEIALTLGELAAKGGRVTRVRLLAEKVYGHGYVADISYIHGELPDGTPVRLRYTGEVETNLVYLRKMKTNFIRWAVSEGVYAKGVGLLDEGNWSVLY
jgi:hypothetical protein